MTESRLADPLLEVDGISLSFKGVKAITDVSFKVGTGAVSYTHLTLPTTHYV